ncbi:MAG: chemotaxis protein CheB [Chloroflexia bacterium]
MHGHDIIVIGASAGGVEALQTLARRLPADLPAAVFVVQHIPAQSPSLLPTILNRAGKLPAVHPQDKEPIHSGRIYVAPPDRHLLLDPGCICMVRGPKENRSRPAIDPLFRTAARVYGPRVIGVVLTGALDDGTAGLQAIKQRGGIAVVQDPDEAMYPSMPRSAQAHVDVDYCLPMAEIGGLLAKLAKEPAPDEADYPVPYNMDIESQIARADMDLFNDSEVPGTPSPFSCPECHGTLWELKDGEMVRYRCRVGHTFSAESMMAQHNESLEDTLWAALRALEESAALARRMARSSAERGHDRLRVQYEKKAAERERQANTLGPLLVNRDASLSEAS